MGPTGLLAFWRNYDRKLNLRAVQLAEDLGYDSFWVPEAWGYDAFTLLTEMATHTRRIRLGTAIVNVFSRSPGVIAMTAASLDEISEGRFILGIGTSGARVIEGFHGRRFDRPLTQIRDVIKVVRTLLGGGRLFDAKAELAKYRPFMLAMRPLRRAIPIYVAALKQKSIEAIGELADGWIPTFWPWDRLSVGREWIAAGAARAGRDPSQIVTAPFTLMLPEGGEAGERAAREMIAFYLGGMGDYYLELLTRFGFGAEADKVAALFQDPATRRQAPAAVTDAMMDALTIRGDPAACLEELARRRAAGMHLPIFNLPVDASWDEVERFIRVLAPRA